MYRMGYTSTIPNVGHYNLDGLVEWKGELMLAITRFGGSTFTFGAARWGLDQRINSREFELFSIDSTWTASLEIRKTKVQEMFMWFGWVESRRMVVYVGKFQLIKSYTFSVVLGFVVLEWTIYNFTADFLTISLCCCRFLIFRCSLVMQNSFNPVMRKFFLRLLNKKVNFTMTRVNLFTWS